MVRTYGVTVEQEDIGMCERAQCRTSLAQCMLLNHLVKSIIEANGSKGQGIETTGERWYGAHDVYTCEKGLDFRGMSHVEMMYSESGWVHAMQKGEENGLPAGILFWAFGKPISKEVCNQSRCLRRKKGRETEEMGACVWACPAWDAHQALSHMEVSRRLGKTKERLGMEM